MTQHRFRLRVFPLALTGVFAALMMVPAIASAVEGEPAEGAQTWAVAPANAQGPDGRALLDYIVEPNDTYADFVAVRNLGDQPLTVSLYAQDAVQSPEDAFEVLTPDDIGSRVGAWVELDAHEVTVPPRENVVVPFTITVPFDAEPGDHAGAILAVSMPGEGDGTTVQYRVGTRLYLRVAGPVEAAIDVDTLTGHHETRWAPFATSPLDVAATLENTGNVRVVPDAQVRVAGMFNWWSAESALDGYGEILPGGAQSGDVRIETVPPIGPLWVTVDVVSVTSAGQDLTAVTTVTSETIVVWAVPWVLLIAIALLLIAAVVAIINLRRRRRARASEAATTLDE